MSSPKEHAEAGENAVPPQLPHTTSTSGGAFTHGSEQPLRSPLAVGGANPPAPSHASFQSPKGELVAYAPSISGRGGASTNTKEVLK